MDYCHDVLNFMNCVVNNIDNKNEGWKYFSYDYNIIIVLL